jgi:hypothetical protein
MCKHVEAVLAALQAGRAEGPPRQERVLFWTKWSTQVMSSRRPGIEPQAAKVQAMTQLPAPCQRQPVAVCLRAAELYRCYLPGFARTAQPWYKLLQSPQRSSGVRSSGRAFDALKHQLCTNGVALGGLDPSKQFVCRLVGSAWPRCMCWHKWMSPAGNTWLPVLAAASNVHEKNYTPWRGEFGGRVGHQALQALAAWAALRGGHRSSAAAMVADSGRRLWGSMPAGFCLCRSHDFHIRHRPGVMHVNADVLSRMPLATTVDGTWCSSGFGQ